MMFASIICGRFGCSWKESSFRGLNTERVCSCCKVVDVARKSTSARFKMKCLNQEVDELMGQRTPGLETYDKILHELAEFYGADLVLDELEITLSGIRLKTRSAA